MARGGSIRLLTAVVISASLLLAVASPSLAKFPYFSVTLDPVVPRPDEPVTVTVRTWADAQHRQPAGFAYDESPFGDLLVFRRIGDGSPPARVAVPLVMVKVDLYRGEVTLPTGEWRLVAFPHGEGACTSCGAGYPEPIDIVVRDESVLAQGFGLVLAGAVAAMVVGASMLLRRRSGMPRRSAVMPT